MAKQNAFLAAVNKEVNRRIARYEVVRMQIAEDAAFMAANEVLHLGPTYAEAFGTAFVKYVNWLMGLILDDAKDDKEIEYAKAVTDRKLKPIVGEKLFVPYDERYGNR